MRWFGARRGTPRRYKRPPAPTRPCGTLPQGWEVFARMRAYGGHVGGGIFAKTAKTPPLQSALRGGGCGVCRTDHHLCPCGHLREGGKANHDAARRVAIKTVGSHRRRRAGQITTRHAASLRPPRNGRIGFKPRYSKRETAEKCPYGSIFYGEGFSPPPCNEGRFNQALAIIRRP